MKLTLSNFIKSTLIILANFFKFLNISSIDFENINFEYSRFSIANFAKSKKCLKLVSNLFFLKILLILTICLFLNLNFLFIMEFLLVSLFEK